MKLLRCGATLLATSRFPSDTRQSASPSKKSSGGSWHRHDSGGGAEAAAPVQAVVVYSDRELQREVRRPAPAPDH